MGYLTFMSTPPIERRGFLRAAGIGLALPFLESVHAASAPTAPLRMVCIGNEFGMFPGAFWPKQTGPDYELTTLLKPLADHRNELTLLSHLDHGLKGGHFAVHTFLTGIKAADAKNTPEGGISLDQRAAEHVGAHTRFPSLTIGSETGLHGGPQMSWTRTGTRVPPIPGPRELFKALFLNESTAAKRQTTDRIKLHGSILDAVLDEAHDLQRTLNATDRSKLDEYFSAVRDVEMQLTLKQRWQHVPKPDTDLEEPMNQGLTKDLPLLYDLIALALQTDSTRVATLEIGSGFAASDLGIKNSYHGLSHHGHKPENIELLVQIETYQMEQYARFLEKLKNLRELNGDGNLLDRTMVLMGSGMGNANAHTNADLPIILAGGGFKHGEHKAYPTNNRERVPLNNLYVSMLQRFGVETDFFSTGMRTLTGLDVSGS
jgi:hypothetical protein